MTMSVRLPSNQKRRLQRLAKATERSSSWLAQDAIRMYLEMSEWQIEAIKEGLADPDRVAHEQVAGWLKTWGTDEETGPPK